MNVDVDSGLGLRLRAVPLITSCTTLRTLHLRVDGLAFLRGRENTEDDVFFELRSRSSVRESFDFSTLADHSSLETLIVDCTFTKTCTGVLKMYQGKLVPALGGLGTRNHL